MNVSMAQVFKAVDYANSHPDKYLNGTTNWCAAVAFDLNRQANAAPQPPALGGEPEVEWPEFHDQGMGCGLEDRSITDRYEAMRYGWDEALERCASEVVTPLQAEIENLKLECDAWKSTAESFEDFYRKTEVELDQLKARCDELDAALETAEKLLRNGRHLGQHGWQSCVEDFLTRPRQSALSKPAGSEQ